jgi:hypothetical protein
VRQGILVTMLAMGAGCKPDDTEVVDTDGGGDSDTLPACTALTDGEWDGGGSALGMTMGVTLTMDATACTFTLTNWSMNMGDMPDAGTLDGDTVTMGSSSYWSGCEGTVDSAEQFAGSCADGASFGFSFGG